VTMEDEMISALRRYGWLRDEGDGERLHTRRNPLAQNDEERCWGFYDHKCNFKVRHAGIHQGVPMPHDEWTASQRKYWKDSP